MPQTPGNLYDDARLRAEHARLLVSEFPQETEGTAGTDGETSPDPDSFFDSLLQQVHGTLAEVASAEIPLLHVHRLTDQSDAVSRAYARGMSAAQDGIHCGLEFVSDLNAALMVIAGYLTENFLWQVAPPGGIAPALDHVVTADAFPGEALSLYSQHLIPEAESSDGYHKRPFQLLMEFLEASRFAPTGSPGQTAYIARTFPKPLIDFADFCTKVGSEGFSFGQYLTPDKRAHFLRLHLHLLLDGLLFAMAHELAHHQLNDFDPMAGLIGEQRAMEVAADRAALSLLDTVPGFQPRSLLIVFSYVSSNQRGVMAEQMDHPLAGNRLMILAESLLSAPGGEDLRADVNAGMALLAGRPEAVPIAFGWPNEDPEDLDIFVAHYADMDSTAHVLLYVDRPPRHGSWEDAWIENAFVLAHLSVALTVVLRDRVEPERVFARGRALYHPTVRPDDLQGDYRADSVLTRLELTIGAPPEWVVAWPGAELAIESADITHAPPDLTPPQEGRAPPHFYYTQPEVNLSDVLSSLLPLTKEPGARRWLLVAARRFVTYQRPDEAIQLYEWLYEHDQQSLRYHDLVSLCGLKLSVERYSDAEAIALRALEPERPPRPGFRAVLMQCHASRNEIQEAYEQAFLEMFVIGVYGDFFEETREYSAELAADPSDPVMARMREFISARQAAEQAADQSQHIHALAAYREARVSVLEAQRLARADFIFLRETRAELEFEICLLEDGPVPTAKVAAVKSQYTEILQLMPTFVPAVVHLAEIALLEGDQVLARRTWEQAYSIAPFNKFVVDFRERVESANPDFHVPEWFTRAVSDQSADSLHPMGPVRTAPPESTYEGESRRSRRRDHRPAGGSVSAPPRRIRRFGSIRLHEKVAQQIAAASKRAGCTRKVMLACA
jgi:hypothetical protein